MERLNPQARRDAYGSRINRMPSPALVMIIPPVSIVIASLLQFLPIASGLPYLPPLGFMMLVAWRIHQPSVLALWAGIPLGLVDDLYSGQPFGSAIMLWSLTILLLEIIEVRFPWRGFGQNWLTFAVLSTIYILVCALLSGAAPGIPGLIALGPQILLSIVLYPMVARMVARLDRLRLTRFRVV